MTKCTARNLCLRPVTLFKKRLCYRCLNFVKLLRTAFLAPFFKHLRWLILVFSLKLIFSSFYIWQDCKYFTKLVSSDFFLGLNKELYTKIQFLGLTKLNSKAVVRMFSITKFFQEISENSQRSIWSLFK